VSNLIIWYNWGWKVARVLSFNWVNKSFRCQPGGNTWRVSRSCCSI